MKGYVLSGAICVSENMWKRRSKPQLTQKRALDLKLQAVKLTPEKSYSIFMFCNLANHLNFTIKMLLQDSVKEIIIVVISSICALVDQYNHFLSISTTIMVSNVV